ncbi:DUF881 domain-containing protein [Patescibacteria group bacterium]|nr:DUF881 domain-containing protein [Patescibacteria group bacterium]
MFDKINEKQRFLSILGAIALLILSFVFLSKNKISEVEEGVLRETESNFFQEIKVLKEKNEDLKVEIDSLGQNLLELEDRDKAISAIESEIIKYEKLSGNLSVFGSGVALELNEGVSTPWVIDLINQFFGYGAEAVSLNGIRITNGTSGFDTLPNGQISLKGSVIVAPYSFEVICNSSKMMDMMEMPGNIIDRASQAYPEAEIKLSTREVIKMD